MNFTNIKDLTDNNGNTALHKAVTDFFEYNAQDSYRYIARLIADGWDRTALNNSNRTAGNLCLTLLDDIINTNEICDETERVYKINYLTRVNNIL
jgi:hypothetical protein